MMSMIGLASQLMLLPFRVMGSRAHLAHHTLPFGDKGILREVVVLRMCKVLDSHSERRDKIKQDIGYAHEN